MLQKGSYYSVVLAFIVPSSIYLPSSISKGLFYFHLNIVYFVKPLGYPTPFNHAGLSTYPHNISRLAHSPFSHLIFFFLVKRKWK